VTNSPKARFLASTALAVLVLDVITKHLADTRLTFHMPHQVIGDFLRFTLSYNTGAAFGISLGGSRWIYVGLTVVILFTLWGMYRDADDGDRWQATALGLIVGGALGNLYDRVRWDRGVVDFIDVGIGDSRFWTFNIADSGISVGATLMVLLFIVHSRRKHRAESPA
jgi:signal peptidase II